MQKFIFITFSFLLISLSLLTGIYFYYDKEKLELTYDTRRNLSGRFIKLTNGYVHYELEGPKDGELLVLIHGAGSGYYAWDKNFYQLANSGYRVLRYDLYGRGYSDRPLEEYNLSLFANQLIELLDSLHLEKPFHLASVSMGASIATYLTFNHPDKIKKLIYIDPAAINNGKKNWVLRIPLLSDFFMTTYWSPRAVQKQMAEFYNPSAVSEYSIPSESQLKFKGFRRAILSTWLNACSVNMYKELASIGKNHSDILLLWGDHDPLTPIQLSDTYRKLLPTALFFSIKNSGHLSNYENPTLVNQYILSFLAKKD